MFKKLIVKTSEDAQAVVQELLIEQLNEEGDLRTVKVLRERKATPQEVLLHHTGYGRFIRFDFPSYGNRRTTCPDRSTLSCMSCTANCTRVGK